MKLMTPQHLRALAHAYEAKAHEDALGIAATLRSAADQLEAVRAWLDGQDSDEWDSVDLDALDSILTTIPHGGTQ